MNTRTKENFSSALGFVIKYRVLFILAILCIGIALVRPVFFNPQNLINVLRQQSAGVVLALGFTLVLGTGGIDLSVGCMIGMLGIIMAKLSKVPGMPMIVVLLCGAAIAVVCGLLNASIINTFHLPPFIVTLATMSVFKGVNYIISDTTPVNNIASYMLVPGQGSLFGVPILVWIMAVATVILWVLINKTLFGRQAIAMGGNSEAAKVSGVNTKLVNSGVFITIALCAFVSSVMITGRASSAQPAAGQGMEMDAIAASVIGGTPMTGGDAKVIGTLLGAMIVGVINNGLNLMNVNTNVQLVVKGALILFAVILDAQSAQFFKNSLIKKASN